MNFPYGRQSGRWSGNSAPVNTGLPTPPNNSNLIFAQGDHGSYNGAQDQFFQQIPVSQPRSSDRSFNYTPAPQQSVNMPILSRQRPTLPLPVEFFSNAADSMFYRTGMELRNNMAPLGGSRANDYKIPYDGPRFLCTLLRRPQSASLSSLDQQYANQQHTVQGRYSTLSSSRYGNLNHHGSFDQLGPFAGPSVDERLPERRDHFNYASSTSHDQDGVSRQQYERSTLRSESLVPVGPLLFPPFESTAAKPQTTHSDQTPSQSMRLPEKIKAQHKSSKKRSTMDLDHTKPIKPEHAGLDGIELLAALTDPNDMVGEAILLIAKSNTNPEMHRRLNEMLVNKGKGEVSIWNIPKRVRFALEALFPDNYIAARNAHNAVRAANGISFKAGSDGTVSKEWYADLTKKRQDAVRRRQKIARESKKSQIKEANSGTGDEHHDGRYMQAANNDPSRGSKINPKRTAAQAGLENYFSTTDMPSSPSPIRKFAHLSTSKTIRASNFPRGRSEEEIAAGVIRVELDQDERSLFY